MITEQVAPKLRFINGFSDKDAFDARGRGYLSHVLVELGEGRLYPVFFYDVVRLQQDLEENARLGRPFIADPGMIVVGEITLEAVQHAVEQLGREEFFEHLTPITQEELASASPYQWPPQIRRSAPAKKGTRRGLTPRSRPNKV